MERKMFSGIMHVLALISILTLTANTQQAESPEPLAEEWGGSYGGASACRARARIDGTILVTIPGDVDGDGDVDASDLFDLSKAYGSTPGDPNWDPNCDIDGDGDVDASDLFDLSINYGTAASAGWNYFQIDTVDTYAFPVVGRGRNDSTFRVYFAFALGDRKGELWEYTWNSSDNSFTAFNAGSITNLGASGDICIGYGRNDDTLRIYVAKGASGIIEEYTWNAANSNYTISQLPSLGGQFYTGPWVGTGRNDSTYRVYIGLPNGTAYELTWNGAGWDVFNIGSIDNFVVRGVSGGYGRNDSTVRVYFGGSGSNSGIYEFTWNQTYNNYTVSKILDVPDMAFRPPAIGYGRSDTTYRIYCGTKNTGDVWELTWSGTGWNKLFIGRHGTGARRVRIADGRNDGTTRLYVGDRPTVYELTWNAALGNFSFTGNITAEPGKKWIWIGPGRNDSINRIYVNNEETGACWLREYSYSTGETYQDAGSTQERITGIGKDIPSAEPAQESPTVFVDPDTIIKDYLLDPSYQIGDTFQVHLNISDVTDLYIWNVNVTWNPALLNLTEIVSYGDFLAQTTSPYGTSRIVDIINASNETGYAAIAESILGEYPGISGSGRLVTVEFLIVGYGFTNLTISVAGILPTELLASAGVSIAFTATGGYFGNRLAGDANGDGTVNILDAAKISAHWYPGPPIGPLGYDREADINLDGYVDIIDLAIVSTNWERTVP